jgi:hypothetical protein
MISEQIKKEISEQLDKKLQQNSIESIVLNAKYVVLTFVGFTTGVVNLQHFFLDDIILNKRLLIKSIKLIPFALNNGTDELFNDTSNDHFIINENARITKCIDAFTSAGHIQLFINGVDLNLFPSVAAGGQVLDLFVDNIYYNYKAPISSIDMNILGSIVENLENQAEDTVKIKVLIEAYTY